MPTGKPRYVLGPRIGTLSFPDEAPTDGTPAELVDQAVHFEGVETDEGFKGPTAIRYGLGPFKAGVNPVVKLHVVLLKPPLPTEPSADWWMSEQPELQVIRFSAPVVDPSVASVPVYIPATLPLRGTWEGQTVIEYPATV